MSKYKDGQIIGYDLRGDGAHPIKVQFFTEDGTYGSIVCEVYGWGGMLFSRRSGRYRICR